jgi:hypothetical protein
MRSVFGLFVRHFEAVEDVSVEIKRRIVVVVADSCQRSADTYRPKISKRAPPMHPDHRLPDRITFQNHDPYNHHSLPSRELLKYQAACAKILDMSGAGDHVDKIIMDGEAIAIRSLAPDGSTNLNSFWASRGFAALMEVH